ncbi:hypothetical protein EGW08_001026, partial [Elysia chlorotica]
MADVNKSNGASKSEESARVASPMSKQRSRPQLPTKVSTTSLRKRRRSSVMSHHSSALSLYHVDSAHNFEPQDLGDIDLDQVPWWTSHRLRLAILCFLGFVSLYAQRVNLSIAIVSMVDHSSTDHLNSSSSVVPEFSNSTYANSTYNATATTTTEAPADKCGVISKSATKGEFRWNKELEGLLLGAFFWGYLVFQVPGGRLSEKFGAKRVIGVAMFPVAILNILSPVAARTSPYLFLVVRVLVGLGEGVMYPAAQALWARWAPPNERSRLIGFSYAGGQFGNALIFPIGGFLCAYGFDGGWPSVFYVIGSFGFLWCCAWVAFAHDSPDDDKTISEIEKQYIKRSIGQRNGGNKSLPWRAILTSGAVWAIVVGHACGNYGAYMLLTKIPAYMKEVLKFDIKSNGLYSMLPYLTFWFVITLGSMMADSLITRGILSIEWTRKLMSCIGTFGPAIFLIGTGFMDCTQQVGAVIMLTVSVGLCGFHFSGFFINHGDVAPAYAGTLFGISNTAATIPGILSPYIVSAMTKQ